MLRTRSVRRMSFAWSGALAAHALARDARVAPGALCVDRCAPGCKSVKVQASTRIHDHVQETEVSLPWRDRAYLWNKTEPLSDGGA